MIWIVVAKSLRSNINSSLTRTEIQEQVFDLFQVEKIAPVMIEKHLVSSEDRQADKNNPRRGGSRNRYLFRKDDGEFRLYKKADGVHDGRDKTGPYHPKIDNLPSEYQVLVAWYMNEYFRL